MANDGLAVERPEVIYCLLVARHDEIRSKLIDRLADRYERRAPKARCPECSQPVDRMIAWRQRQYVQSCLD